MSGALGALVIGEPLAELRASDDGTLDISYSGDALNVAVRLARGGAHVTLATAIGTDRFSAELERRLRSEGVHDDLMPRVRDGALGLYLVETDHDGERHFTYWRDSSPARRLVDVLGTTTLAAATVAAEVVHVSGITLAILDDPQRGTLVELLAAARAAGTRVVFDPNVRARLWPSLGSSRNWIDVAIGAASVVLASTQDLDALDLDIDEVARTVAELVVTDGARPTRWWCASSSGTVAVPATNITDTTGAGDAFDAAYTLARTAGHSVADAVTYGHDAASDTIRHNGGLNWS